MAALSGALKMLILGLILGVALSGCGIEEEYESQAQGEIDTLLPQSNRAPTINATHRLTRLNQPLTIVLDANDPDGDALTFQISSQPRNGTAVVNENNSITYTPNSGALGLDEFEVEVFDQSLSAIASVSIDNNLSYEGRVSGGLGSMQDVQVIVATNGVLQNTTPGDSGTFKLYGLPDGEHAIKIRKPGHKSSPARTITLNIETLNQPLALSRSSRAILPNDDSFALEPLNSNGFIFHWEEDQSTAGYDYAAYINEPLTIEFLDEQLEVVDDSSSNQLQHNYNILLSDNGPASWTQEHAYRLLETMKMIPQEQRYPYSIQSLSASKWLLTNEYVADDIQISRNGEHRTVTISAKAFVNASPKIAKVNGKRGIYYSQRLHHALVRFVTDNGLDKKAYEKIFKERFGISTVINDYSNLTAYTTAEAAGRFQDFHPEEIIQLINMFEEMPKGMHILPELRYLVRRLNGTPHPLYSSAPAVAWTTSGYIEFMESAFNTSSVTQMHRLIIHEKSHFLWENQFSQALKDSWIELGGWYLDTESTSGWSTSKQTEFVSAYAHSKTPNEDMAESISYFIINPDLLKSRAIGKYNFIRDIIMQGNIYISQIREDLTFQVYNLYPDYIFPGKIKRVDISVEGEPENDKVVTIELELHALDVELEGAKHAYMRILSEIGTFKDLYLYPVDVNGDRTGTLGSVLRGSFTLSKYAKSGFWRTPQITITDTVGNQRMEGANDFGWKLYINNPLEDTTPPEYVSETANLAQSVSQREGQEVQIIHATWQVNEDRKMRTNSPCYASMNDEILTTYRVEGYGSYDAMSDLCMVDFVMPHYMPSSIYSMNYIAMFDDALNSQGTYFTISEQTTTDEAPQQLQLITNNQDIEQPELDLNNIFISAVPSNPAAPNGETIVTVDFKVRDNISGYNVASLNLRDPQGINHQYWVYNDNTWALFPIDNPTVWQDYSRNIVLPIGSAPGTWGMSEMMIFDRAGNFKLYDFTEIVRFDVSE